MSDSLRPHESQHARPPCPSPTPRVHSDSRPSSRWCHPTISSSGEALNFTLTDGERHKIDPPKEVRRKSSCPIHRCWAKFHLKSSAKKYMATWIPKSKAFSLFLFFFFFARHHLISLLSHLLKRHFFLSPTLFLDWIRSGFAVDRVQMSSHHSEHQLVAHLQEGKLL